MPHRPHLRKSISVLTLTLAASSLLGAQAAPTRYPLTVTDDLGRPVTLKAEPMRVISVLPSNTETICALGACSKLVGVDTYSDFPAPVTKLPKVGGLYDPNIEAMIALKPDLVIVSKYGKLAEPLTRAGINVIAVNPEKYDDIFTKTALLGKLLNRQTQAQQVITQVKRDVARVEVLTRNVKSKPLVYFEIDPTPYSIGPNSFMGVLLGKAGARNVIPASLGDFPKVDPEMIVKANPALILGTDLKTVQGRPGWKGIQAVKTGRVVNIPTELNTILGRPGPRIGQALLGLAKLVHPELFR